MNWELPENLWQMTPETRGYCSVFDKETGPKHGAQCTAFDPWPDWPGSKPNH